MLEVLKISFSKFSKSSLLSQGWRGQAELSHVVPGLAATSRAVGTTHRDMAAALPGGGGSGRRDGWGKQRQIALGDRCRGCRSVGSCTPLGKGQFVAFK